MPTEALSYHHGRDPTPDKTTFFRAVYLTKKQKDQNKPFWAFCFLGKYTDFRFAWGRVFLRTTAANSEDWAQKCPTPPNRKAKTFGGLLLTTCLAGDGEQLHDTPANAQDVAECVRSGSNFKSMPNRHTKASNAPPNRLGSAFEANVATHRSNVEEMTGIF